MAKSELSRWCGGGSLIINVENFVNFQNIINNDYFVRHMVTDVPPDLFHVGRIVKISKLIRFIQLIFLRIWDLIFLHHWADS